MRNEPVPTLVSALPPARPRQSTRRGAALLVAAGLLMTIEVVLLRYLEPGVSNGQILLIRGGVQLVFAAGWVAAMAGLAGFATRRHGLHALRGVLSAVSWWFYFEAFRLLDLAVASTLMFSSQIFLVVLAAVVLGERPTAPRIGCTLVGFIGVVVATGVLQGAGFDARVGYGLTAAAMGAALILLTRVLTHTERTDATLFYIALYVTAGAVPPVLLSGAGLSAWNAAVLLAVGIVGTASSWLLVEAYRHAEISALAPFPYLRLVFAAAFGTLLFGETLAWSTVVGAALIVAGALTMVWIERR